MRLLLSILFIIVYSCKKSDKDIYVLEPDTDHYYLLKENGDSIKIETCAYKLNYSEPKFITISQYNHSNKKYEVECKLLKVKNQYYNYYNLSKKDSIDGSSFVFLNKEPKIAEYYYDKPLSPIGYWEKSTEIFKVEPNNCFSRQLYFTSPKGYILDFGKYYFDENFKIFKIEIAVNNQNITYQ